WIHVLFPYLVAWPSETFAANPYLGDWRARWEAAERREKPTLALGDPRGSGFRTIPPGLSTTEVRLTGATPRTLELVSRLLGLTQAPSARALAPQFLWAVIRPDA